MILKRTFIVFLTAFALSPSPSNAQMKLIFHQNDTTWLQGWLSKFYNREIFEWTGKNIEWSNPPFSWSLVSGFPMSKQSAIFVLHHNNYHCGNNSCNFDIWVFDGNDYKNISGNMSNKFDEEVEISDRFINGMPLIFIGPRAYGFDGRQYREL